MRLCTVLLVVLCLSLGEVASAQRQQLKAGDPAPALDIDSWVEGEAVSIQSGRVYVLLFWESISDGGQAAADTLRALSHLKDLSEQYEGEGLLVLGISTAGPDQLRQLARRHRGGLGFGVGADRRSSTLRAWVRAAGLQKMPAAFIVGRNGRIMYVGDPLAEDFDEILSKVVRGRYDPGLMDEAEPKLKAARRDRGVKNWRMATRRYDEVIALDGKVFAEVALERFEMMLVDMGETEQAYGYARDELLMKLFPGDPGALRMLATKITVDPQIPKGDRDLTLALVAATAAVAAGGGTDPAGLATLALVHFHLGDVKTAVELQTQAYFLVTPRAKADYKRVLAKYQEAAGRSRSVTRSP